MSFERLTRGDWIAWVAALALLLVMALDWYGSQLGDEARRIQETAPTVQDTQDLRDDARVIAEGEERNAFQADAVVDRVLLVLLLSSVLLAFAAGVLRAAGKRFEPPGTPSAAAALTATLAAVLVAYRMVQEPGLDAATNVKLGALLGLVCAGVLALGAATALRDEQEGRIDRLREERDREPEEAAA